MAWRVLRGRQGVERLAKEFDGIWKEVLGGFVAGWVDYGVSL